MTERLVEGVCERPNDPSSPTAPTKTPPLKQEADGAVRCSAWLGVAVEQPVEKVEATLAAIMSCYGNLHVPARTASEAGVIPTPNVLGVTPPTLND